MLKLDKILKKMGFQDLLLLKPLAENYIRWNAEMEIGGFVKFGKCFSVLRVVFLFADINKKASIIS